MDSDNGTITLNQADLVALIAEQVARALAGTAPHVIEAAGEEFAELGKGSWRKTAADEADMVAGGTAAGLPLIYWKRLDGEIFMGPTEGEYNQYRRLRRKGYLPLPQYGPLPTAASYFSCCAKGPQVRQMLVHQLLARGGAKELPLQFVLDKGWHREPLRIHGKTVTFPQLDGVEIEEVICLECDRVFAGVEGTRKHLQAIRDHCMGAHHLTRDQVEIMLQRQGKTLGYGAPATVQATPVPPPEPESFRCEEHDRIFETAKGLQMHRINGHRRASAPAGA